MCSLPTGKLSFKGWEESKTGSFWNGGEVHLERCYQSLRKIQSGQGSSLSQAARTTLVAIKPALFAVTPSQI
jgi:hypothetical protein